MRTYYVMVFLFLEGVRARQQCPKAADLRRYQAATIGTIGEQRREVKASEIFVELVKKVGIFFG